MKNITINANKFSNISGFFKEMDRLFISKDTEFKSGRDLETFNKLLKGGFGVFDESENISLIWSNSLKSENDLGYEETITYYQDVLLKKCDPDSKIELEFVLNNLRKGAGHTFYDKVTDIILTHDHIEFFEN